MPEAGKTTLSTISAHKQRLRRAKLPRTFKHFFEIAKRLNVRFVWVDSLCIIQDSEDDWQRETARMGQIYSGAICTIAAESAKDCQGGIWLESKTRKTETKNKVIYETITQEENLRNYISVCDQRFHRSPLQRRGWTLQEQNLSRRVLHFTFSHIYWECREQKEDIPAHKLRPFDVPMENRVSSHNRASSHTKMYVPELSLLSDPFRTWRNIVEEFTSRQLSRSSDRLPALSGLASELQLHMNSEYMVGIWLGDLKGLLWTIGGESIICAARTDDSAPTWSWASYDRYPITYRHISNMFPVAEDENISSAARMLHPHIIPAGLDPKGRVTYGSIQLKCRVRWVTSSEHIYTSRFTFYREDDHTRYLENCSEENPIMIIRILESRTAGSWGLILKQSIKQGVEEYERVGVIGGIDHRWFDSWFDKMVTLV
ncbi:heterokaryon incompatibility protein-domain-containing protein [Bisporella sp. PMI_857]|nr:heterokaryon incompatibility protein-domain-containing protein [Bisporella sp. PMI_857]